MYLAMNTLQTPKNTRQETTEKQQAMVVEILSSTVEHSSQYSSGVSTATTESGPAGRPPRPLSLPVAIADESVTSRSASSRFKGVVPQPNGRWGAQILLLYFYRHCLCEQDRYLCCFSVHVVSMKGGRTSAHGIARY